MVKRVVDFLKKLRGTADSNFKRGEEIVNTNKVVIKEKLEKMKEQIPAVKEKLDKMKEQIPAVKENLKDLPNQVNKEAIQTRIKDMMRKYEKFTGVDEIMALQKAVVESQEKFIGAQDRRREAGNKLMNLQWRLKEIHEEMQSTPKSDQKYLKLVTDEHNTIVEEQHLRKEFVAIEREEREHFNTMSAAVKLSHERERAHADRNKYWYIIASVVGTALGVLGSTLNNRMKMTEFREMLVDQIERSNNTLLTVGAHSKNASYGKSEDSTVHQRQLKDIEMRIAAIANNQGTILEHMRKSEHHVNVALQDIKNLAIASSAAHTKSDKALKEAIKKAQRSSPADMTTPQQMLENMEREELVKKSVLAGLILLVLLGVVSQFK